VTKLPATARDVSMVFQSYALFPHMTVLQNVSYGLQVSGFAKDVIAAKAQDVLKQLGLGALSARYPNELSGGQQQRVAVARAIVLEPRVLLFDEPLSNLDAKLRRYVRQEIRDLQQALGLTVVYVTHDQEEALAVSDTVVVMNNATVAQMGSPRELHDRPQVRVSSPISSVRPMCCRARCCPCRATAPACAWGR
jgi:iron(III) transport system ATP-binding protein